MRSLAAELTDPTRLARLELPGAMLVSSYDREGGNNDFNHYIRKGPPGWIVLADLPGPGYVSRFWMTGAEDGTWPLRFYFDGERRPRLETTLDAFCGQQAPFQSPLAAYEPFCWYSWVPLPYRKRLVVMTREGGYKQDQWPRIFYQICACALPAGTAVESFPKALTSADLEALERAREGLRTPPTPGMGEGRWLVETSVVVAASQRTTLARLSGSGVVRELQFSPDLSGLMRTTDREAAMRALMLRVYWDEAPTPSVEVPFGDFFGSVWTRRQFQCFYFGMSNGVYVSRFPMPFATGARLELENPTGVALPVSVRMVIAPGAATGEQRAYFHAQWRKSGPSDVGRPHRILQAMGRGHYVGCILTATSLDKSWWLLEGDETIRVDGESVPRWRGTGLEDYFNGGWYYGGAIVRPFHGLLFKAPFRTIQYRIHQVDPVRFTSAVAVDLERGPDHASHGWLESTAFYYLDRPTPANTEAGNPAWRMPPSDPLAAATLMLELSDLEWLGDYSGARAAVEAHLERFPDFPFGDVLKLRLLGYSAHEQGFESVRAAVENTAAQSTNSLARQYAADWLWYESSPSHALLGVYASGRTGIYVDGRAVGEAGDPQRMKIFRVTITPGRHVLALRTVFHPYPRWVQACLRTHQGDVYSSPAWKYALNPDGNWPSPEYDDSVWKTVGGPDKGKGPPEEPYVFQEPHPFVGLQARARGLWVGEADGPSGSVVFRTVFTLGEAQP